MGPGKDMKYYRTTQEIEAGMAGRTKRDVTFLSYEMGSAPVSTLEAGMRR
jgi:hypothetical protein